MTGHHDATTVSIRIVADCGARIFQFAMEAKRATTIDLTTVTTIIFIVVPMLLNPHLKINRLIGVFI